ncbi:MAG: hypothetical protein ABIS03_12840 [Gemmatimonadaceae bacterium]
MYKLSRLTFGIVIVTSAAIVSGCRETTAPLVRSTTGGVRVSVITSGLFVDRDVDGYRVSVDDKVAGVITGPIGSSPSLLIQPIDAGTHQVTLDGLVPNCATAGPVTQTATVIGDSTISVSFSVTCAPNIGTLLVKTTTLGEDIDGIDYFVEYEGSKRMRLSASGTTAIPFVRAGRSDVTLLGIPRNCSSQQASAVALVPFRGTVEVAFEIRCVTSGSLRVDVTTSGVFQSLGRYDAELTGAPLSLTLSLNSNGTELVSRLLPASYELGLSGIPWNCVGPTGKPAVVIAGSAETHVKIDVTCSAPPQIALVIGAETSAIYLVNADGTSVVPVTSPGNHDIDPAWSRDGMRIAFASDRDGNYEIYTVDANGSNLARLTSDGGRDARPAWSPDGNRIAFVTTRDGSPAIYVMNANGDQPVRLTQVAGINDAPDWSPDGTLIAFAGAGGIWVMRSDGEQQKQITSNEGSRDNEPAWSPDGRRIAFSRMGQSSIFVVNADGSGIRRWLSGFLSPRNPSWSPDGGKIMFATTRYPGCESGGFYNFYYTCDPDIVVADASRTYYGGLSSLPGIASNPTWRQ